MALLEFESVKGLDVITQDAYVLGEVLDVRFEDLTWNIMGMRVRTGNSVSKMINVGSGKSIILVRPGDYTIRDVILMHDELDSARSKISADTNEFGSAAMLLGMRVQSSEAVLLGTVDTIMFDLENWKVVSIKVKLDKNAHEPLGVKKGILGSKRVSGIMTSDISDIGDTIRLSLDVKALKGRVTVD